jgi:hypothetical protein
LHPAAPRPLLGPQQQDIVTAAFFRFLGNVLEIKKQGAVQMLAIAEDRRFPQLDEMNPPEGDIRD